ncbi:MAG TPA: glycosyltransferase family 39 protein [Terracidiphilus sp.]|nr:glycosyltransferase family 39 protein [Terracidiphilus sp.]
MTQSPSPISQRTPLRPALLLATLFGGFTFLAHFASSLWGIHLGYGYFRDELYFLICGRHLAWGYVDQPPLVALQARVAQTLFGLSPTGIRTFSFLASGVTVGLTGLIARQLGGRRSAQALAMSAVLAAPVFLGTGNYLSMNSFEPCFWMGSLLVVLRIADGSAGPRAWLLFGLLAGLGIENKHATVFFLIALLVGLLLSPQRRILFTKGCAAGVAVLLLLALPNFLWQVAHQFATYQFLSTVAHSDKNLKLPPFAFLFEQVKILLFSTAPLWIGGLVWFAFARVARPWRFVAFTYLFFLGIMMAMHAKDYYVAPIYPVLFAAGAVGFSQLNRRAWPVITYAVVLVCTMVFATGPIVLTILPPNVYGAYTAPFGPNSSRSEKFTSPLPQILSDRFGWPQMVEGFATRYNALPPDVRARTGIFCGNYGEASAVNILGPAYGLPPAISGHQNYFYWGWNAYSGESMLTLGKDAKDYTDNYAEVVDLGPFDAQWTMDFEHLHYFWLRHRKRSYAEDWAQLKYWY